ncbi:MAG TPA: glycosyltransferase family A protein [Thermoplasmata archaeon]|nr:glycosyltransferase family A protein [Thermoplasmata archaeon]
MLPLLVVVLLLVGAALVLLYQGAAIVLALQITRLGPAAPARPGAADRRVSVVIAARNEANDLGPTLDALLAQDYPALEVVVVDGGSTDGTREVIERRGPRVRRVEEPSLPAGWVGKNWACWTGANATHGDWLLFLDADVRLAPAAVRTVIDWATREHADLASIGPQIEMVGFWERVVLPFYVQVVLTYFRTPRMHRPGSRAAMANGQCWLTPRSDYFALGGHEAVRGRVLEDVAIARRYRDAGRRLRFAWTPELGRTRMYTDRREMFEGLLKNVHGLDFSAARMVGFLAGLVGLFLLPLGLLPLGLLSGSLVLTAVGAFLYVALFGKHVAFNAGIGASAAYGLLFPLAVAWYVVLVTTSLVRGVRGRPVAWKGRQYALDR